MMKGQVVERAVQLGKEKTQGDLTLVNEYSVGSLKKMKSNSKWCPVKGQDTTGRNGNTRNTISTLIALCPSSTSLLKG